MPLNNGVIEQVNMRIEQICSTDKLYFIPSHNESKPLGVRVVIHFYTHEECSDCARWRLGPLVVGSWDFSQATINPNHSESNPQWIQAIGVRVVIHFYTREERSNRASWQLGPLAVGSWDLSQATMNPNHNWSKPQLIKAIGVWVVINFYTREEGSY